MSSSLVHNCHLTVHVTAHLLMLQETLKATVDGQQLNLDTQDLGSGSKTLGKAAARYVSGRG